MGFGSSLKKAAKKVGKTVKKAAKQTYHEYDRWTSSKLGSYATPYLSMYDSDGRDALAKSWGGWAGMGASAVNPAAGAVVGTAINAYTTRNDSPPRAAGGGAPAPFPIEAPAAAPADDKTWLIVGGVVGAVLVAAVLVLVLKRKTR